MKDLIRVFKALSDISRLRVLNLLFERECCVCEVEQVLEVSQSKASRILSALYDAGFLNLRKEGLWSLYSINRDEMGENIKNILESARKEFSTEEIMKDDIDRLNNAVRICPCCDEAESKSRVMPQEVKV